MMKVLVVLMLVCSVYAEETEILSNQQPCLQDVHAALREITASLAKQEVEMKYLQAENKEQAAKLEDQQTEVEKLKKQLQDKQVAFSASLSPGGAITLGPFPEHTPLIFKHVLTNIGDAYNPHTGVFTAPLKGAYQFQCYFTMGGSGLITAVGLFKNSQLAFAAAEHQEGGGFGSAAQGATLLLEAGDVVVVKLWQGNKVYDNDNHHTTFSGHMLFPM